MPRMPLPQYTFLCGTLGQGQIDLVKALVALDDNLIRMDFTTPLQEILVQLFPDSCPALLDPLDNLDHGLLGYSPAEAPEHNYPSLGAHTIRTFFNLMSEGLRITFGKDALGTFALRYVEQTGIVENFERVIFSDLTNSHDALVIINHFKLKHDDVLFVHLGDLTRQNGTKDLPGQHCWLPHTETSKRLEFLLKDLTPCQNLLSSPSMSTQP